LFCKEVKASEARAARAAFRADVQNRIFERRALSEEMLVRAAQLSSKWTARLGWRSLNIIHVASAITLQANVFHTFDDRQRRLAAAAGLKVI
jgi:hypothetical protein